MNNIQPEPDNELILSVSIEDKDIKDNIDEFDIVANLTYKRKDTTISIETKRDDNSFTGRIEGKINF